MRVSKEIENVFLKVANERRLFDPSILEQLTAQATLEGRPPGLLALEKGLLTREEYLRILENYFFFPSIDVRVTVSDPAALLAVPFRVAARLHALPLSKKGDLLQVALALPDDANAITEIKTLSKCKLDIAVGIQGDIEEEIEGRYALLAEELPVEEAPNARPAPQLINRSEEPKPLCPELLKLAVGEGAAVATGKAILGSAVALRATDIHLEPARNYLSFRMRIDGIMQLGCRFSSDFSAALVSRIKVISGMDIAERRVPQDGRYSFRLEDDIIDCRISSLPSRWGEKIVIRLLKKDTSLLDIDRIQMPGPVLEKWIDLMKLPIGMILVTGPTGSGKTTTLYATIANLDRHSSNIITLEDPIEYELNGITQVQINPKAGMTFEAGLRSILRQDPDTILVGEIRDSETVETACRAALTGHKIYSTLHTNDAASAVTRLMDMGVQPYLLVASLKGVLAQRLLRTLCTSCAEPYEPSEVELARLGYPKVERLKRPVGCAKCGQSGYHGRQAVFELLVVDEGMHRLLLDRASAYSLREHAVKRGTVTIGEVTRRLVISGITSLAEGERAVFSDDVREQLCPQCERVVSLEFAVCPFCEFILKESCSSCGNPVDSNWDICPTCGTELLREWKKKVCSGCLAPLEPDWPRCPYCGTVD